MTVMLTVGSVCGARAGGAVRVELKTVLLIESSTISLVSF